MLLLSYKYKLTGPYVKFQHVYRMTLMSERGSGLTLVTVPIQVQHYWTQKPQQGFATQ